MVSIKLQEDSKAEGLQLNLELALKVPLLECELQRLNSAYALVPKKIFPLLSRFLLRHELDFRIASLPPGAFAEKYLLWLSCGEQSPEMIPDFILAYIKKLPFCYLFQGFANPEKKSLFLCEYGFKHPLALAELVAETSTTGLFICFAGERSENSIIRPIPKLRPAASVLHYEVDFPIQQYDMVAGFEPDKLLLPLRFIDRKPGISESSPVLFLEKREISWLKEMLYRLPGPLFGKIEWAGDKESLFLFFNDPSALSFFPFGKPFREIASNLFIPADKDIVPRLESRQLQELFQVESDHYSFITGGWRRDLAESVKAPLQQLLMTDSDLKIEFQSDPDMNGFVWDESSVEPEESILFQSANSLENAGNMPAIPVAEQFTVGVSETEEYDDNSAVIKNSLNEYGNLLRRQGDFLGAATCFSLAQENLAAADCFAEAALTLAKE